MQQLALGHLADLHAAEQALLHHIEHRHHAPVGLRKTDAPLLHIEAAHGLEQAGLQLQIAAEFGIQLRQSHSQWSQRKSHLPQHRQQAVPDRAHQQQNRHKMRCGLLRRAHAHRRVERQNHRSCGDRAIPLAHRAQHGESEGEAAQRQREQRGRLHDGLDAERHQRKAAQRDQQGAQTSAPVVVGLGQSAGDHAEKQRHQPAHVAGGPAPPHRAAQRHRHAQRIQRRLLPAQAMQPAAQRKVTSRQLHDLPAQPTQQKSSRG